VTVATGLLTGDRVALLKPKVCPSVIQYQNLGMGNHFDFVLLQNASALSRH
jgi:hypothetical protein